VTTPGAGDDRGKDDPMATPEYVPQPMATPEYVPQPMATPEHVPQPGPVDVRVG
jgi:hypothetical protein